MEKGYLFIKRLLACIFRLLLPTRVTGLENIPEQGAFILCSNHLTMWDPMILISILPRQVVFLAKKELFKVPVVGWVVKKIGAQPVDRGNADMAAIRKCFSVLKEGGVLGIFPQGHRYPQDDQRQPENGASLIALRARAPMIPVHISAPVRLFHRVEVRIGQAVDLADLNGKADAASLGEATRRLSSAIWADSVG